MPHIRVRPVTLEALGGLARPFESPSKLLDRIFGDPKVIEALKAISAADRRDPSRGRATPRETAKREQLPQSAYWAPVLAVLRDAPRHRLGRSELHRRFYGRMKRALKSGDLVTVDSSGEERWRVAINFALQHLKNAELADSPERGTWRATPKGLKARKDSAVIAMVKEATRNR